jgi:hypothetical protein
MTWIVKDSNDEYYGFRRDSIHWHQDQSKADRFRTREYAEKIAKHFNVGELDKQYPNCRVVKLKRCPAPEKKLLHHPKQGTVFLDLTMPSLTSNIVTCVYEEFVEFDHEEYVCSTNAITAKEDVWGTIEEYHQHLAEGKIKVIWEPKS